MTSCLLRAGLQRGRLCLQSTRLRPLQRNDLLVDRGLLALGVQVHG